MHNNHLGPTFSPKIYQLQVVNGSSYRHRLKIDEKGNILVKVANKDMPLKKFVLKQDITTDVVVVINKKIPGICKIVDRVINSLPSTHKDRLRADVIV